MTLNGEIDRLYEALPEVKCQRKCQAACGPIIMSQAEADRIAAHVEERPLRAAVPTDGELCPALSVMGGCMIYEVRPAICRLYGILKALPCQWGCVPEHWINDADAYQLMAALDALSEGGPTTLPIPGAPIHVSTIEEKVRAVVQVLTAERAN